MLRSKSIQFKTLAPRDKKNIYSVRESIFKNVVVFWGVWEVLIADQESSEESVRSHGNVENVNERFLEMRNQNGRHKHQHQAHRGITAGLAP